MCSMGYGTYMSNIWSKSLSSVSEIDRFLDESENFAADILSFKRWVSYAAYCMRHISYNSQLESRYFVSHREDIP